MSMRLRVNHCSSNMALYGDHSVFQYTLAVTMERNATKRYSIPYAHRQCTPQFSVLSHQNWRDVFLRPCFGRSPKEE